MSIVINRDKLKKSKDDKDKEEWGTLVDGEWIVNTFTDKMYKDTELAFDKASTKDTELAFDKASTKDKFFLSHHLIDSSAMGS
jgi:hypothetical protein